MDRLFDEVEASPGYELDVDLAAQTVTTPGGEAIPFEVDAHKRHMLVNGLDEIGLTLERAEAIAAFEQGHHQRHPWVFEAQG